MATATTTTVEELLSLALRHVNAGQRERARLLCEHALAAFAPHAAVHQLLAVLDLQQGDVASAREHTAASLALRADHLPTLLLAGEAARGAGALPDALRAFERAVWLAPEHAEAWFQIGLVSQDLRDFDKAAAAFRRVLALTASAEVEVNLGIVLQEAGQFNEALRAFGRAYRLRDATFGRIAHALSTPNVGRLWLNLDELREALRRA
ncbi:MAG: tetratricopeptide repeat protein [Burkholderiales bacterium]